MTVTVLLFASYADALGASSLAVELDGQATVADVMARVRKHPGAERLPLAPLVAINEQYADATALLRDGDELAIIPPVAGGMTPLASLVRSPIDPLALIRAVSNAGNGAVILFLGAVRQVNEGRDVTGIDYAAYQSMAARELQAIVDEGAARYETRDVVIVHRLGELQVEEVSVGIAIGHAHRDAAYALSRWVIEELKRRVPIWKREHYADEEREWVDPSGQPSVASPS